MGKSKWVLIGLAVLAGLMVAVFLAVKFTPPPARATLSGNVWLDSPNGETFLQRGAFVYLLKTKVTAADMRRAAVEKISRIQSMIRMTSDNSGFPEELAAFNASIDGVKGEISINEAMDILNAERFKRWGEVKPEDFADVLAAAMTTTADVNAHYEFKNVPPGTYLIVVKTAKGALTHTVDMNGRPRTVDLH